MLPVLYSFRRCPYAMRARLALASAGIVVELREIVLHEKPGMFLNTSQKGIVTVVSTEQVLGETIEGVS